MARVVDGEIMNLIGTRIKQLRKEKHISQQMLSDKLELLGIYVCRGSVSRVEDLSRSVTDMELYAFARVFDVNVGELFDKELIEKKYLAD